MGLGARGVVWWASVLAFRRFRLDCLLNTMGFVGPRRVAARGRAKRFGGMGGPRKAHL